MIGIVGGVGPYAGLELNRHIFDQTIAERDQDYLKVILVSAPEIPDRTEFLLGKENRNPAESIFAIVQELEWLGASVVGIPCNTAHAPQIIDIVMRSLNDIKSEIRIVNMVSEVGSFVKKYYPGIRCVGVLGTNGTVYSGIYTKSLEGKGFKVRYPDEEIQSSMVHDAIYHREFGIKAHSNPVKAKAREMIFEGIDALMEKGAECIILGCTELPLAIDEKEIEGKPVLNPTLVLARALIAEVAPGKLKPAEMK